MSTSIEPSESVRPRLERLRRTLRHWQVCSNEYETLRRELSTLPPKANREDMLAVGSKFSGKLVDEKEVNNLLGDELGIKRTVVQVITEISHRIDYAQENVVKFEQQIEQGENEVDENEEDEEDEYEDEDTKYKPTAEGLISPELRTELEEFRRRIKERGEAARAEEARWAVEEKKKPKKKRKGGVRFAEEPEEVPATVPEILPLPALAQATKDTISNPSVTDTNDKSESMENSLKNEATGFDLEEDEDAKLQSSIAEEAQQSSGGIVFTAPIDPMVCENSSTAPRAHHIDIASPRLPDPAASEAVSNSPHSASTSPPSG